MHRVDLNVMWLLQTFVVVVCHTSAALSVTVPSPACVNVVFQHTPFGTGSRTDLACPGVECLCLGSSSFCRTSP